jgi:hypothetical protein
MKNEQLRMQMLAGIITESQYKAKLNEEIYTNSNNTTFRPITSDEFDNLNEFGVIGEFTSTDGEKYIVDVIYDKEDDFDSDEEAKNTFDSLLSTPNEFSELLWRSAKEDLGLDTNEFKLKTIVPVTFAS